MKKLLLLALSLFITHSFALDWEKELARDYVTYSNGKMVMEDYLACPSEYGMQQIKIYSEATNNGKISRDTFVSVSSVFSALVMMELGFMDECTTLDSLIGGADYTLSYYMNEQGLKQNIKIVESAIDASNTWLWSELLK